MNSANWIKVQNVTLKVLHDTWLSNYEVRLDVLRLDEIDPVISGNKWFKLKYYLEDAQANGYKQIGTFGGAYSNHIAATAAACKIFGLQSIGIIRGEQPMQLSHTLSAASNNEMQLQFVSREAYKNKALLMVEKNHTYWIPEGGYGILGAKGASEILSLVPNLNEYTHIVCAVGTGTTLAGILQSSLHTHQVIGVSAMKGNLALTAEVRMLLLKELQQKPFTILSDAHFGGYAKYNLGLIDFMNTTWHHHSLPTDFVYTAKTLYALQQQVLDGSIQAKSHILFIHTGGLQGNQSLPSGTLPF